MTAPELSSLHDTDALTSPEDLESKPILARVPVLTLVAISLVALGVMLRVAQYAHNRALWLDESALALQIVYKTPLELIGPLGWHQNSPIAFLLTVKFITMVLGPHDWALRVLPIFSGVASVFVFVALARTFYRMDDGVRVSPWSFEPLERERWDIALVAVAFFAVNKHLLYYSSELRHYSTDILFTSLLFLLAFWARERVPRLILLGAVGVLATWYSLASIFVLGALSITRLIFSLVKKNRRNALLACALGAVWLGSFLVHLHIHDRNIELRGLGPEIDLHLSAGFMPMPPASVEDLKWFRRTVDGMFYMPVGLTYRGLGAFAFLAGCIALWKRNRERLVLLLIPFALTLLASGLHRYPFRDRYILFLTPCFILLMAEGIRFLTDKKRFQTRLIGLALFALLFAQPMFHGLKVIGQVRGGYEIRPLLAHMQSNWHEDDGVYIPLTAVAPFMYYAPGMDFAPVHIPEHLYDQTELDFPGLIEGNVVLEPHKGTGSNLFDNKPSLREFQAEHLTKLLERSHSVWILFEHDNPPPIRTPVGQTDDVGLLLEMVPSDGASLYRYQAVHDATAERPAAVLP